LILLVLKIKNFVVQINLLRYFQDIFWHQLIVCLIPFIRSFIDFGFTLQGGLEA